MTGVPIRTLRRWVKDELLAPVHQGQGRTSAQFFLIADIEAVKARKALPGNEHGDAAAAEARP